MERPKEKLQPKKLFPRLTNQIIHGVFQYQ